MAALRGDGNQRYNPVNTSFDERTGIILAHVNKIDFGFIDKPMVYQRTVYQPKQELHITIISKDAGILLTYLQKHPDFLNDIQELIISTDWSFYKSNKFYLLREKPGVETIVQMVEIPELQSFLAELSKLAGHGFLVPPTHITLYVLGTEKGIGIPDRQSLQQLMKAQIQPEEVRIAKRGDEAMR